MSFWAACVITNFFSAIPYLGPDLVEFLWGGFSVTYAPLLGDEYLLIPLIAGMSFLVEKYINITFIYFVISVNNFFYIGRSAGVRFFSSSYPSPLASTMTGPLSRGRCAKLKHSSAAPSGVPVGDDNSFELSFMGNTTLQRLNAVDLFFPYLVGLIEGDGYFSITKNGKYIKFEFGIELNIRDVQLLHKIKKLLGSGVISFRKRKSLNMIVDMVSFRIRDKDTLKNIIIPIFDKYPMYSNKQYDYLRFKEILLSNVTCYSQLSSYSRPLVPSNMSQDDIFKSPYFPAWLIGFIEAEGSLLIYKPENDSSLIASFEISQTNAFELISAIRTFLSITANPYLDNTNNFKLKTTSVRGIENVIKFLHHNPVKLLGYKRLQYILWLKKLRTIPKYSKKIDIPQNY
jgi:hypothetical protein